MDVPNCFYIIPCDDEAIKRYLSNNKSSDSDFSRQFADEFIDKLFQTYIRIPSIKEVDMDKYIADQLSNIEDIQTELGDKKETVIQILYYAYKGETPRNVKRFLNDFTTYYRLAKNCLPALLENIPLFTVMVAIKQKWPEIESTLAEMPTFFEDYNKKGKIAESEIIQEALEIFGGVVTR